MTDPIPGSYRELTRNREKQLDTLIERGVFKPFFLHHFIIYTLLPLVALLISPHRRGSTYVRYLIFSLIVGIGIEVIRYRRALFAANGYVIGQITVWWIVWSATLLVFNDPEKDFRRIERRTVACAVESREDPAGLNVNDTNASTKEQQEEILTWQSYPETFSHRLDWALGLIFSMRGPEWNWRISSFGPLPESVSAQLAYSESQSNAYYYPTEEMKKAENAEARKCLRTAFTTCLTSYISLDIIKVLMMRDTYFWGVLESPPPYPFNYLSPFPVLVQLYRHLLIGFGIRAALIFVTSFNPIIFLGLSLAFPRVSRNLTSVPQNAPWLYSDVFGPFFVSAMDNGLAGCWGHWWHQLFRFAFLSTAQAISSLFPSEVAKSRPVRRGILLFVAFGLSGIIHACGSYAQPEPTTRPLSSVFLFFIIQIPGIIIQEFLSNILLTSTRFCPPRWLRRTTNLIFVISWLMLSGKPIIDDFARGGIWLTEPIPVSPLRGMGFGAEGEGWWCWREPWVRVWSDGTWWGSGVRIL